MDTSPTVAQLIEESVRLEDAGEVGPALERAQEALARARAEADADAIATALNRVGVLYFRIGHYDEACAFGKEALAHGRENTHARADTLLLLGMCATETDDLVAGEDYFRRAIDLSRRLGYGRALLRGLHNLAAGVYMPRGQFDLALAADEEALRLARSLNAPDLLRPPLILMAWIYWLTGQYHQAQQVLAQLRDAASAGSASEGYYYCLAALLAEEQGKPDDAIALYGRARSVAEKTGEPSLNVLVRLGMSYFHRGRGDAFAAYQWANDAATVAARAEYLHFEGIALVERGRALWEMADMMAAETDWRAAIQILEGLGAAFDLAHARLLLAVLLHQQRRAEATSAWCQAARGILAGNYGFLLDRERSIAYPLIAAYLRHPDRAVASLASGLLTLLERAPAPPLSIVGLGSFEVRCGYRTIPVHAWRQRRAGELFRALLLAHRRTLTHEQIAEALWPGRSLDSMRPLLHQATSALRRALEPGLPDKFPSRYLRLEEGQIALELPAGSVVDFEAFEQQVQRGEWEEALRIYKGDLFPDDLYAEWALLPRERLKRLYVCALYGAARQRIQSGKFQEATDACLRILEVDPWQEEAVLLGMQAYAALGDRASAIRLYQNLERALREELDAVPQATLTQLYKSLLHYREPGLEK